MKASTCINPDLFWALRGGGGSTYGVVTSVVLRTHKNISLVRYNLNVTIPILPGEAAGANNTFWEFINRWHTMAPEVNDLGGSGYYYPFTNYQVGPEITANVFTGILLFFGQKDTKKVEALLKPLHDWLYKTVGTPESGLVSSLISPPVLATDYFGNFKASSDNELGANVILGSRLLSRELLSTPSGVQKSTEALKDIYNAGGSIIGLYVTPGSKPVDSAAHSAWRKAIVHIVINNHWQHGDSFAKQAEVKGLMSNFMVPRLKKLDFDTNTGKQTMGAYLGEADKGELNWQDSFWGEKYGRLKKIKGIYDPNGVFWCNPCVGSEDWDLNGICKFSY